MEGSKLKKPTSFKFNKYYRDLKIFWNNWLHKCFILRECGGHEYPVLQRLSDNLISRQKDDKKEAIETFKLKNKGFG
jgi:hypothetical protein